MTELPRAPTRMPAMPAAIRPPSPALDRVLVLALVSVLAASLGACQQGIEAAGRTVDAPGIPVALVGIEGAPDALQAEVNDQVMAQASARRIDLVSGTEHPRYRLKGYLTAYSTENGETALAFVWDVFDETRKRAQRVSTTTTARGQGGDPWAQIGEGQIARAASQSMNQVATFLAAAKAGPGTSALALSEQ